MRRAQIVEPLTPLVLSEVPVPETPRKGAIVKTLFSGICHSDLNQWKNKLNYGDKTIHFTDNPKYKLPLAPGHEISGVVQSLGPEANNGSLAIGDRVLVYPWIGCGKCGFCLRDCSSLCNERYYGIGIGAPGGYATHVVVSDQKYLIKVPDSIPMDVACMLPCSGLTTYNAVTALQPAIEKITEYKGKTSVLLIGAGGLGLWCLQIAKTLFPSTTKLVVADINPNNLKIAKSRGCDETVLWDRNKPEEEQADLTKAAAIDGGYDGVIDLVNSTVTAERGFACTHRGSTIIMVGLYGGEMKTALIKFVHGVRTVRGVLTGTLQQLKEVVNLASQGKLVPPPMQYFSLDDAYEGMSMTRDGKSQGRNIIKHQN